MSKIRNREKYIKIKKLGCLDELHDKLACGEPYTQVARWLQEEMHEYSEVSHKYLCDQLRGYKEEEMPAAMVVAPYVPADVQIARDKIADGTEEVLLLRKAMQIQLERIRSGRRQETTTGKLNSRVGPEISRLVSMIETSHRIKQDLGLSSSMDIGPLHPELSIDLKAKFSEGAQKALGNVESSGKVLDLAKKLLNMGGDLPSLAGQSLIDIIDEDDGDNRKEREKSLH